MYQGKFKIIENDKVASNYCKLRVIAPQVAKSAAPGQFIHIRIQDADKTLPSSELGRSIPVDKPFLRRPFAVHNVIDEEMEILYKIRGPGTRILSAKEKGETLDIIGPLGNGFEINGDFENTLIVAGGIGVAPLLFLGRELVKKDKNVTCLIGASCKDNILCRDEFENLKVKVVIATEDGSEGIKAKVTDVLKRQVLKNNLSGCEIFASGPKDMLRVIAKISQDRKVSAQVSLDEIIACGVGTCLGCAVMTKDGYKMVCKDGPVFKADNIIWE